MVQVQFDAMIELHLWI